MIWFGPVSREQRAGATVEGAEEHFVPCTGDGAGGTPRCRALAEGLADAEGRHLPALLRQLGIAEGEEALASGERMFVATASAAPNNRLGVAEPSGAQTLERLAGDVEERAGTRFEVANYVEEIEGLEAARVWRRVRMGATYLQQIPPLSVLQRSDEQVVEHQHVELRQPAQRRRVGAVCSRDGQLPEQPRHPRPQRAVAVPARGLGEQGAQASLIAFYDRRGVKKNRRSRKTPAT